MIFESSATGRRVRFMADSSLELYFSANQITTEVSRQIGFLRFPSLDASRDFMDRNAPYIYFRGPNAGEDDRGTKVRIAYSREREDRRSRPEGEWTCRMVSRPHDVVSSIPWLIPQCLFDNFSTRQRCFRCQADRAGVCLRFHRWIAC